MARKENIHIPDSLVCYLGREVHGVALLALQAREGNTLGRHEEHHFQFVQRGVEAEVCDRLLVLTIARQCGLGDIGGNLRSFPILGNELEKMARDGVQCLICELQQRLVDVFRKPPFTVLVPLGNPDASQEELDSALDELFNADRRSLDSNCIKVRDAAGTRNELIDNPFWRAFLFKVVNMIPVANSFIECVFAGYKQWLGNARRPVSAALLHAKHFSWRWRCACDGKRERAVLGVRRDKTKQARPAWIIKNGQCAKLNSRHTFMSDCMASLPSDSLQCDKFREASKRWTTSVAATKAIMIRAIYR